MKKSSVFLVMALFIHSGNALADMKSNNDSAILKASEAEKTLSNKQKLFHYRCEMIEKYLYFNNTPTDLATKHSCDKAEIGIALYAGKDLGSFSAGRYRPIF